eukprot:543942-Hanusia_phi.AAC.1
MGAIMQELGSSEGAGAGAGGAGAGGGRGEEKEEVDMKSWYSSGGAREQDEKESFGSEDVLKAHAGDASAFTVCSQRRPTGQAWVKEGTEIIKLGAPVIGSLALQMGLSLTIFLAAGGEGAVGLAGVGLGVMYVNVTGASLLVGLSSALETLAAHFHGAQQPRQVSLALQRAMVVLGAASLPIAFLWFFATDILYLLGVEWEVAQLAGGFCRLMLTGLPAMGVLEALRKYLQAQGIMQPFVYASLAANGVHLVGCWLLVTEDVLGLGVAGAALSLSLAYYVTLLLVLAACKVYGLHKPTWHGWDRECLQHLDEFLKLALPGGNSFSLLPPPSSSLPPSLHSLNSTRLTLPAAGMICLEWWCFEIVTLLAAQLGTTVIAAQTIMFNTTALFFMVACPLASPS